MKVHYLPSEQEKLNKDATNKLRRIGYALFALFIATIAIGAWFYLWPPSALTIPELASEDGQTSTEAIVVAPDLILSPAKISGPAQFSAMGEHRHARRINSTTLPDGTEITLLRLENSTSVPPIAVVVVQVGDALVATAPGQEWHGSARAKVNDGYPLDPDFPLNAGTPVYRDSDRTSLVGFEIKTPSGPAIIAAQDVFNRFPELSAGH